MTPAANNRPSGSKPVQQADAPSHHPQTPDAVEVPAAGQSGVTAHGIEPVIGHLKNYGRLGRIFLKGRDGDKIRAFLAGAGYNTRQVFKWLRLFLARIMVEILNVMRRRQPPRSLAPPEIRVLHGRPRPRTAHCRRPYAVPPGRGRFGERKLDGLLLLGT